MGFKQLMQSFLFEDVEGDANENDDVQESRPLKAEPASTPSREQSAPVSQPVSAGSTVQSGAPVSVAVPASSPVMPSSQASAPVSDRKTAKPAASESFFSQMSDVMGPTGNEEPEKESKKRPARPAVRRNQNIANMSYSAVMSPIFGNLPDDQKDHSAVHNAIELPEPNDDADLIRVISPMYGSSLPVKKKTPAIRPAKPAAREEKAAQPVKEVRAPHQAAPDYQKAAAALEVEPELELPSPAEELDLPALQAEDPRPKAAATVRPSRSYLEQAATQTGELSPAKTSSKGSMDLADYLSRPSKAPKTVSTPKKSGGSK